MAEGADMVMVKPAMTYLDVAGRRARTPVDVPLAAYHVSGEYAMVKAAAAAGLDRRARPSPSSSSPSLKRAGADFVLTYFAAELAEVARWLTGPGHPRPNADWFARARRVIPGGVDSPVRSFASVGGTPYTVVSGRGRLRVSTPRATATSTSSSPTGPSLLGHAHPVVTGAVTTAAGTGHDLRRADAGRGPAGRGDLRAGARLRAGPARVLGHRGRHERRPPGPRRHGPRPDRQVRRLLPRPLRRAAGRRGQRGGHARAARTRPGCPAGAVADTVVVPYNVVPDARRAGGLRHRRAGGGEHEPGAAGARVPRGAAGRLRRGRAPC